MRTMANIGLAYRSIGQYEESMPYFLNSLLLNPQATHIWGYIRSSCLQMNKLDLLERVNSKDANAFRDLYTLIDPANLPKQNLDRLYDNEIWSK